MPVRKADLGSLTKISEGGFGVVYRVPSFRLPTAPATPLAYKEFTKDEAGQAETAQRSVLFRELLPPRDRADLDRCAVWPRTLVEDNRAVSGLLMPLIPDDFFFDLTYAQTGQKQAELRDLK
jgi:eukaryotic-like serine/threonine-protein kinase